MTTTSSEAAYSPQIAEPLSGIPRIAVLIPCYNEGLTIGSMVAEIKQALPQAKIYICDNRSSDDTAQQAQKAGAVVLYEARPGKGNAVRRLFSAVDADIYVMADGDATYDIPSLPKMIRKLQTSRLAMVVGQRAATEQEAYRAGHRLGNKLITGMLRILFGAQFTDVLSGYRVFNRGFIKSFPVHSSGFTIETALTVHALQLRLPCEEVETPYHARPEGSFSKLSTYKDGMRISLYIARLFAVERPLSFFGLTALAMALLAIGLFIPLLLTYLQTGLVPRVPTLIIVGMLVLGSLLSFLAGLILQGVTQARQETKHLAYLRVAHDPAA